MFEGIPEKVLRQIQKILNMKESLESLEATPENLAQIELTGSRLQHLLMQHNLDLEEVKKQQIGTRAKIEITDEYYDLSDKFDKREANWVMILYAGIARNNLCIVFMRKAGVRIAGHKENVQIVLYIADQMISKVRMAEKIAWQHYDATNHDQFKEKRGTFRRGFFQGAAFGIDKRLSDDKKEMEKSTNPFAVMIINKTKEVEDFLYGTEEERQRKRDAAAKAEADRINSMTPEQREAERKANAKLLAKISKTKPRKGPRQISSNDGWRIGYDAGQKMNINKGMDNASTAGNLN